MDDVKIKDIPGLRDFAAYLQWLSGAMVEQFSKAGSQANALADNWNDSKSAAFIADFSVSVQEIGKIAERMEEFSRHVLKKCEILEMYQNS